MYTEKELDLMQQAIELQKSVIEAEIDAAIEDGSGIVSESSECSDATGYNTVTEVEYTDEVDDLFTEIAEHYRIIAKIVKARKFQAKAKLLKK